MMLDSPTPVDFTAEAQRTPSFQRILCALRVSAVRAAPVRCPPSCWPLQNSR